MFKNIYDCLPLTLLLLFLSVFSALLGLTLHIINFYIISTIIHIVFLVFLGSMPLINSDIKSKKIKITLNKSLMYVAKFIVKLAFIIILIIVNYNNMIKSYKGYPAILWSEINNIYVLYAALSILLLSTIIGYDFIDFFLEQVKLSFSEKIVFGFSFSVIILIIISAIFYSYNLVNIMREVISILIIFTMIRDIALVYKNRHYSLKFVVTSFEIILISQALLLFSLALFIISINPYMLGGDNWVCIGFVVQYYKLRDIYAIALKKKYPIAFSMYLLALVETVSLPVWNTYTLLYPFVLVMHFMSVHVLLNRLLKNRVVVTLARTLYMFAGGLAWVAAIFFGKTFWVASFITLDAYFGDYFTTSSWWVYKSVSLLLAYNAISIVLISYHNMNPNSRSLMIKMYFLSVTAIIFSLYIHIYEFLLMEVIFLVIIIFNKYRCTNLRMCNKKIILDLSLYSITMFLTLYFSDAFLFKSFYAKILNYKILLISDNIAIIKSLTKLFEHNTSTYSSLITLYATISLIIIIFLISSISFILLIRFMYVLSLSISNRINSMRLKVGRVILSRRVHDLLILVIFIYELAEWCLNPFPRHLIFSMGNLVPPKYYVTKWFLTLLLAVYGLKYLSEIFKDRAQITNGIYSFKARVYPSELQIFALSWIIILGVYASLIWFNRLVILIRVPLIFLASITLIYITYSSFNKKVLTIAKGRKIKLGAVLVTILVLISTMSALYFYGEIVRRSIRKSYNDTIAIIDIANAIYNLNTNNSTILTSSDWLTLNIAYNLVGEPNVLTISEFNTLLLNEGINLNQSMLINQKILDLNIRYLLINKKRPPNDLCLYLISISILIYYNNVFEIYEIYRNSFTLMY